MSFHLGWLLLAFSELQKNDCRCRTPPGSASTSFLWVGMSRRRLRQQRCPHSNRQRWREYTSTPPVKRARNKLRHEQSRWEVALTHKADVLLFEAHKSTADIVAGIPQIDVHVVTHLARDFKGMLNQELVLFRLNKSLYSSFWYTSLPFSFSIPYIVNKVEF